MNAQDTPGQSASVNMGKWISQAWDLIFGDLGTFLLLSIIYLAVTIVSSSTVIGGIILIGPLTVGFFYILLQKLGGKPYEIGDIGKGFNYFAAAVISNILISLLIALGLIFCIIPGFIITALYIFTPLFIVDRNMDFWQAMEASRKLVGKHIFEMTIFVLLLCIILIGGLLVCGVGVIIALPLCFAAISLAYADLAGPISE